MSESRVASRDYTRRHGEDSPEIRRWSWQWRDESSGPGCAGRLTLSEDRRELHGQVRRRRTVEIAIVTRVVALIIYAAFAFLEQREIAQHGL
jgi:hypothetical protein